MPPATRSTTIRLKPEGDTIIVSIERREYELPVNALSDHQRPLKVVHDIPLSSLCTCSSMCQPSLCLPLAYSSEVLTRRFEVPIVAAFDSLSVCCLAVLVACVCHYELQRALHNKGVPAKLHLKGAGCSSVIY